MSARPVDAFRMRHFDLCDKEIAISGPNGLALSVDYDDVDHGSIEAMAHEVLAVLNENAKRIVGAAK